MRSLFGGFVFCLIFGLTTSSPAAETPNFIIINCDDLGYADLGCFGSDVHRTPRIDKMASEGLRLTNYYVTSGVCSPSRSSLMTGCYPRRVNLHVDHKGGWVLFPRSPKGLNPSEVTIAEVLKQKDYATSIIGKWHLGDQPEFLPTNQGFDSYFGIPYSNDMGHTDRPNKQYPPLPLVSDLDVVEAEPDQRYLTKRYTEKAVEFITTHAKQPFFLYLPHTMPHWPQYASEDFAGKSANGKWGDAVEEIDWSTGVILDKLEELKIAEKTLIVFMSDNGGATNHGASNAPLKGGKGSTFEGGMRVCGIVRWPGHVPAGQACDQLLTSMDWLPTFAQLAGAEPPQDRIIDGRDISGVIQHPQTAKTPHDQFFYYWMSHLECVRSGDWKLRVSLRKGRESIQLENPELYNLRDDIGETKNVADAHPEIVARLRDLCEQARNDLGDGDTPGENQRPAGMLESARALTDP
ncbi:MAG: sulfatase [Planctomycetaceae bacterium]|nr:sulfatase [Planctomycetaceae bacterium]